MFSGSGRIKLQVATYAALFCLILHSCIAQVYGNTIQDCASSCGNIHNIGYPFRLETDPKHCGNKNYELACVANTAILYADMREEGQVVGYPVQAINYNNLTIRLADPNVFMHDCTLRVIGSSITYDKTIFIGRFLSQLYYFILPFDPNTYRNSFTNRCQDLILASCPLTRKPEGFNSSYNKVAANNSNSASRTKRYWYANVGAMKCYDLENSCRIEYKSWTSLLPEGANIMSYKDVNNSLAYGFELSWESACCASEASSKINCSREPYFCSRYSFAKILLWFIVELLGKSLILYATYKVVLCFCGTPCVTIFLIYKWRRRQLSAYDNIEEFLRCNQNNLIPVRYSYSQIKKMTKDFKQKLGEGGYGSVYKGKLRSSSFAAVKILDKSKANGQEFINEVATIGRFHHTNVVQLIGFCVEGSKCALIYEFMINGSLDKYVFSKEGCISLNNEKIYSICLGVAYGIKYLHQGCNMRILHFDIKPHNILLDENFIPKISDFGLAKLYTTDNSIVSLTEARGTIGYMAPELFYKNIGCISYKADVYGFGMLLIEMLGKRKNLNAVTEHSSRIYFPLWIYDEISAGKNVKQGDDPEEENKIVKKMTIVALWCIQLNPMNRPSMHKVIEMLEGDVEHLQVPPKPFVLPQEVHTNDAGLITCSQDTSCNYSDKISLLIEAD